jgi:hypothetical protein
MAHSSKERELEELHAEVHLEPKERPKKGQKRTNDGDNRKGGNTPYAKRVGMVTSYTKARI